MTLEIAGSDGLSYYDSVPSDLVQIYNNAQKQFVRQFQAFLDECKGLKGPAPLGNFVQIFEEYVKANKIEVICPITDKRVARCLRAAGFKSYRDKDEKRTTLYFRR